MIKLKRLLCLFLFLFPAGLYACSCANEGVVNNFQTSEFVAKAKIIKVTPDPENSEYHDAVIEIINLYKGQRLSKVKIMSSLNSSCAFLPDENSTWIIFAQVWQGTLSFGFCSGSMKVDEYFDPVQYPNAAKNWGNTIKLREGAIAFLNEHKIFNPNPSFIRVHSTEIGSFKGYENTNAFAVFQIDVNSDFTIAKVKQLKNFQNKKLNSLVFKSMKTNLTLSGKRGKPLAKSTQLFLFCYYYEQNGSQQSFLSFFDI
ncbi:hypothetical protein [Pedobacter foliorum]|uniref:hypothetical protein n=1 Tax=Pedobacter foliorum TaxID=2739058 RepID=UPI001563CECD|nr:hypothetical protein [Pedobacter foliorum]NRF37570.1 hypothetical protein [Pedobacter foliorum]